MKRGVAAVGVRLGNFLVHPSMITVLSFCAFIMLAVAFLPEHMNSQGTADSAVMLSTQAAIATGERVSCSQSYASFSDNQHWHSLERGVVIGSAALTVVSILIASAARGEHIEGAYAATGLTIMMESVLFYSLLHSGRTAVYCVGVAGGGVRLEMPLRYAYWVVTNLKMQAALYSMVGGIPQRQRLSAMAGSTVAIICGAIAGNITPYSPASILLIVLAFLFTGVWLAVYAKLCMLVMRWPAERGALKRSILFCVPFATVFPAVLVPISWMLSYAGLLPIGVTQLLFCIGEFMDKFTMCHLLAVSDLPQHIDKVRLQLLEAETRRAASQAKESAMRTIMRYLFHELRVPLNSIVLGLDDSKEAIEDMLDSLSTRCTKFFDASSLSCDDDASPVTGLNEADLGGTTSRQRTLCTVGDVQADVGGSKRSILSDMPGTSGLASARKWEIQPSHSVVKKDSTARPQAQAQAQAHPALTAITPSTGLPGQAVDSSRAEEGQLFVHSASVPAAHCIPVASGPAIRSSLEDVTRILSMCHTSALGLGRLLDDFLSLEKIEQGKLKVEIGAVQVKRMVDETLRLFRPAVESKQIRLLRTAASDIPSSILGDDHKLRQCLANFVSNAIKFSPVSGQITVRLSVVYAPAVESSAPVPALGAVVSAMGSRGGSTSSIGAGSSRMSHDDLRVSRISPPDVGASIIDFTSVDAAGSEAGPAPAQGGVQSIKRKLWSTLTWLGHGLGITRTTELSTATPLAVSHAGSSGSFSGVLLPSPSPAAVLPEAPAEESTWPRPGLLAYLKVSVEDQGVGISPADQAKLFQPFQQIRAGALQKGNGTGLGLAIVRQIINLSAGYVGVKSTEGHGSTFFFCVPLNRDVDIPPVPPSSSTEPTHSMGSQTTQVHNGRVHSMADAVASDPVAEVGAEWLLTSATVDVPPTTSGSHFFPPPDAAESATNRVDHASPMGGVGLLAQGSQPALFRQLTAAGQEEAKSAQATAMDDSAACTPPAGSVGRLSVESLPSPSAVHASMTKGQGAEKGVRKGSVGSDRATPLPEGISLLHRAVVVDDIAANRQLLVRMLKRRGVQQCYEAADGTEVLTLAQDLSRQGKLHEIQAWLLDEEMPVMNGSRAIRVLREQYGVRAVMLSVTGNALSEDQSALMAAGADAVLPKPVQLPMLNELLQKHGLALQTVNRQP